MGHASLLLLILLVLLCEYVLYAGGTQTECATDHAASHRFQMFVVQYRIHGNEITPEYNEY